MLPRVSRDTVPRWRSSRVSSSASTAPTGVSKRSARHSHSHRPTRAWKPSRRFIPARRHAPASTPAHWVDVLSEEAKEARDAAATILGDRAGSSARIVRGTPLQVLRQARDEADATLLALGARHSSRFLGVMLGDTASELLHDGSCSVLLARPQREGAWQPRRIVVGLDGSAPALAALATADELASRIGATVEVVSATSGGSPTRGRLDRPRGQLGRRSAGRRPRRALTRGGPRRRRLSRPARPPRPRKRQRESRTPGPLLRPGRARRLTPRCSEAILSLRRHEQSMLDDVRVSGGPV